jgi:uncharacterized repeat protein (TIGR02543 family)
MKKGINMEKAILRTIGFAAVALFFCTGCNDKGIQVNDGEVDMFLNSFTDTLTVNVDSGGTVSRVPDQAKYLPEAVVTLTASADSGYTFIGWSGATESKDYTITLKMDGKKTLAAKFLRIYELTVSANPVSGGIVSLEPEKDIYIDGDTVIVTYRANPNYTFTGWSGENQSMDDTVTIIMDGHKELTANFLHDPFSIGSLTATTWQDAVNVIKNDGDDKEYIINLSSDIVVTAATFGTVTGIKVILQGSATVTLSGNGSMLRVGDGQTVILKDAALKGHENNNAPLVYIDGGIFHMEGGTISGNTAISGGGVYVNDGIFTMSEGRISGNTASVNGGGVYVNGGTFTMTYGAIWGNTANSYGGGVYVNENAIFSKTGGLINGYDGDSNNGNVVMGNNAAVQSGSGNAVYAGSGDNIKRKETSAVLYMDLYYNGDTGVFSGEWDY